MFWFVADFQILMLCVMVDAHSVMLCINLPRARHTACKLVIPDRPIFPCPEDMAGIWLATLD